MRAYHRSSHEIRPQKAAIAFRVVEVGERAICIITISSSYTLKWRGENTPVLVSLTQSA